jgi:diamine N-acetyltransferase
MQKKESGMSVQILDVNESNWRECVELKLTEEDQKYVDRNVFAIAEWKFEPENVLKAIYSNSVLVGMLAYYIHDGKYGYFYWMYHLMIETQHQGKGYGEAAVKLALKDMREVGAKDIRTSADIGNTRAENLYKKLGFEETGILEDSGSKLLRLSQNALKFA